MKIFDTNNFAYRSGMNAFVTGETVPVEFVGKDISKIVSQLVSALDKEKSKATKSVVIMCLNRLEKSGYSYNTNTRMLYKRVQASNPMSPNSLFYKEWERGYNEAYFNNLKTD